MIVCETALILHLMKKFIAVIGAGISGMSSAWLLAKEGYAVTLMAKAFSPDITSNKAAAFWFPYHIRNDKRGIQWCHDSYNTYLRLAQEAGTGVSIKTLLKVLRPHIADTQPAWVEFMPTGSLRVQQQHDTQYAVVYEADVPLIETQIFLPYLRNCIEALGVQIIQQEIETFDVLLQQYDAVVNCTGLASRSLCNDDELIPVRGQVALLSPVQNMPIFLDNEMPLYVVPRQDAVIIGGTYEEHVEEAITESATIARLLQNAYDTLPHLRSTKVIGDWAGLRPYRETVRVEIDLSKNLVHNYGHGGSGFTLAFGCASEVVSLVKQVLHK